ncbi:MAG: hypothetical protein H7Z40_14525 [Phycisphaerae bacterium]|nr:hypothetical protein [Gemmatimonadaceae bacterium]
MRATFRSSTVVSVGLSLLTIAPNTTAAGQAAVASSTGAPMMETSPDLQYYHHTVWRLGDQVPAGDRAKIRRTPDGYLWLSAPTGLVRFDGVRFTLLDHLADPALRAVDGPRFHNEYVPTLVDRAGRLWILRPDGALISYADGSFRVALAPGPGATHAYGVWEDGAGSIWVRVDSARRQRIGRLVDRRVLPNTWPVRLHLGAGRFGPTPADRTAG